MFCGSPSDQGSLLGRLELRIPGRGSLLDSQFVGVGDQHGPSRDAEMAHTAVSSGEELFLLLSSTPA